MFSARFCHIFLFDVHTGSNYSLRFLKMYTKRSVFVSALLWTLLMGIRSVQGATSDWPLLLMTLNTSADAYTVALFNPEKRTKKLVAGQVDLRREGLKLGHPVSVGSELTGIVCIEHWTFVCQTTRDGRKVKVDVLIGVDNKFAHAKHTLHLDINPFDGVHVMYLEPIRQAVWIVNLKKNVAKLLATFDENDEDIENIKVDWTHGLLFTSNFSMVSIHEVQTTKLERRTRFRANAVYLACDPNLRMLYWTDAHGSIFKRRYDQTATIERVAKSTCEVLRGGIAPLYFHENSIICLQPVNGELALKRLDSKSGTKTLSLAGSDISAENLMHFNVYLGNSSMDQMSRICEKCSHLCVPVFNKVQPYECACPYGFQLAPGNNFQCENPQALAIVVEVTKKRKLFKAPANATHALLLHDFMTVPPSTRTLAFEPSAFRIVLTESFRHLCLHFPSNNSVECFTPFSSSPSERFIWKSRPADEVVKVTGSQEVGFDVYFCREGCILIHKTGKNRTYALDCSTRYDAGRTFVDHVGAKLYVFDSDGLKMVEPEFSTLQRYRDHKLTKDVGSRPFGIDVRNDTIVFFPGEDDTLRIFHLKSESTSNLRVGFESKHNQVLLHKNNLFYVDDSRIVIMARDTMAGAEFLKVFPKIQVQFTVIEKHEEAPEVPNPCLSETKCPHLCKSTDYKTYKCWCPFFLSLKSSSLCEPTELNILLLEVNRFRLSVMNFGDIGPADQSIKELPPLLIPDPRFVHQPKLQRICVARSLPYSGIICTFYGANARSHLIQTESSSILHMVEAHSSSDEVYWISQKFNTNKLCLNVGSPRRQHSLRLACFPENILMRQPHYSPASKTLIWFKTDTDGGCTVRSVQMVPESKSLTEITELAKLPVVCHGITLNSDASRAYVLTKGTIFEVDVLARSTRKAANSTSNALEIIRVFGDSLFVTDLKEDKLRVYIIGPINSPDEVTKKKVFSVTSQQRSIVDVQAVGTEKMPVNRTVTDSCDSMSCLYHCEKKMDSTPTCLCPMEDALDFGLQYQFCGEFENGRSSKLPVGDDTWWHIVLGIAALLLVVGVANGIWWQRLKNRQRILLKRATREEFKREIQRAVKEFVQGNAELASSSRTDRDRALHLPFTSIIPPDQLRTTKEFLGEGHFAQVFKGQYCGKQVAVKTIKDKQNPTVICEFLKELKVMAYIGLNENIVQFFGAEISEIQKGLARVVLEFCDRGSLESVLHGFTGITKEDCEKSLRGIIRAREQAPAGTSIPQKCHLITYSSANTENPVLINLEDSPPARSAGSNLVPLKQLYDWARQIASGMDYLERQNVVHGDLATRNVLVCDDLTVKISDFGFAKKMYGLKNYDDKKNPGPLPWRWSSPETLSKFRISFKADVWSYGVTVWEIFTLGGVPFPDLTWDNEFVKRIQQGLRPPQPQHMSLELYQRVLMPCWDMIPANRPSFSVLAGSWPV